MSTPLLSLSNGGRKIEDRWLFRSLNLVVGEKDRILLKGPSGSGKTSLLRALCALDSLDEGELLYRGEKIESLPLYRSKVLYSHQTPALFPGSVWDNLRLPFQWKTQNRKTFLRPQMEDAAEALGKDKGFLNQSAAHLSGGEKQLMAALRAVFLGPELLLLDEPTSAMDSALAERVIQWIFEKAPGFIWITHQPLEKLPQGLKTWDLREGKIHEN